MGYSTLVGQVDRAALALLGSVTVTYAPAVGSPVIVTGLFDSNFVLAKDKVEAGVETTGPAVFFRRSDLPTDPDVDNPVLTIAGVAYRVIERMPDDMGGIVLALRKVT